MWTSGSSPRSPASFSRVRARSRRPPPSSLWSSPPPPWAGLRPPPRRRELVLLLLLRVGLPPQRRRLESPLQSLLLRRRPLPRPPPRRHRPRPRLLRRPRPRLQTTVLHLLHLRRSSRQPSNHLSAAMSHPRCHPQHHRSPATPPQRYFHHHNQRLQLLLLLHSRLRPLLSLQPPSQPPRAAPVCASLPRARESARPPSPRPSPRPRRPVATQASRRSGGKAGQSLWPAAALGAWATRGGAGACCQQRCQQRRSCLAGSLQLPLLRWKQQPHHWELLWRRRRWQR
mmetsp:Transcript_87978/g.170463  ORF Transcript_87978/g.170463 Transcript_87978/m.170463 type:complete len:285 (-) Transcript_87978:4-858(-)